MRRLLAEQAPTGPCDVWLTTGAHGDEPDLTNVRLSDSGAAWVGADGNSVTTLPSDRWDDAEIIGAKALLQAFRNLDGAVSDAVDAFEDAMGVRILDLKLRPRDEDGGRVMIAVEEA